MNIDKVLAELRDKYPDRAVIQDPPGTAAPGEVIVELEPTSNHPDRSLALAVVGRSRPHYHKRSTEVYEAVRGELTVYLDSKKTILKPGESLTIEPGVVHSAEGEEAWFLTHSTPGWTFDDHVLAED